MKKFAATSAMALALAVSGNAVYAADFEPEQAIQELVVSGVVESWSGYTFTSGDNGNFEPGETGYFTSGVDGRLSLPLGSNLSIQMDGQLEYGEEAFDSTDNADVFQNAFQFGTHLTFRDPNMGAVGAFGAFGGGKSENDTLEQGYAIGGEAQLYLNDFTIYLQAGHFDGESDGGDPEDAFRDAFFVRGVGRWYITPDSRLQAEFAYADGKQDTDDQDMEVLQWGARYDMVLAGLPVIGDTQVFVGYRGVHAENFDDPGDNGEFTDRTIMVGSSHSFGGSSMKETERFGAGLDLPNFMRWGTFGEMLD